METFTTTRACAQDRFEFWEEQVQSVCGPVSVSRHSMGDQFDGQMRVGYFGQVRAVVIDADPHDVVRGLKGLTDLDNGGVYVCRVCEGEVRVDQDDRQAVAGPGDLVSFDNTRPYALTMRERFRLVAITAPHRLLGLAPELTTSVTAQHWTARGGIAAVLSAMLAELAVQMEGCPPETAHLIGAGIASFTSSLFAERLGSGTDPEADRRGITFQRICDYAAEHLNDPLLTPTALARHHHVSLRYLQKLFRDHGTVPSQWIRNERLDRCRRDLENPMLWNLPVAMVAERHGLLNASHFSRLFRERHGVTPQQYRRDALALEPTPTTHDEKGDGDG